MEKAKQASLHTVETTTTTTETPKHSLLDDVISEMETTKTTTTKTTTTTFSLPSEKNKTPLQGMNGKTTAKLLRAVVKHFKYGLDEKGKAEMVAELEKMAEGHCNKNTMGNIAKVLKGKM